MVGFHDDLEVAPWLWPPPYCLWSPQAMGSLVMCLQIAMKMMTIPRHRFILHLSGDEAWWNTNWCHLMYNIMKYMYIYIWYYIVEYYVYIYIIKQICWDRNKAPEHIQTQKNSCYLDVLKITGCIFCRCSPINVHQHGVNQQKKCRIVVFLIERPSQF